MTDQINGSFVAKTFYPQDGHRQWWQGYFDTGGAWYQSEPMMEFMLRTIREGDSPYWNPFSAAGALGPETLIDNKFSFFTLAYVALGGGSRVYNLVILFLYFWASYFTYRLAKEKLNVTFVAALAATLFYLLNGYAIANTGSNVSQSYLYIPMCLYLSMAFLEKPSALRISGVVLSFAVLFSCTFIPTTITSLMGIYGVLIGYAFLLNAKPQERIRNIFRILFAFSTCLILSLMLLAFIYLPIIENIGSSGTLDVYSERIFYPATWLQIVSLFSPSQFYESYNAGSLDVLPRYVYSNVVFHLGIVAIGLAACSIKSKKPRISPLVLVCFLTCIIGLGRIFGVPGFSLISFIPIIGSLSCQYWPPVVIIPMLVLIALGSDNLQHQLSARALSSIMLGIFIVSLAAVGLIYGLHEPNIQYKEASIILSIVTAVVSYTIMVALGYIPKTWMRTIGVSTLVLLLFAELIADSKIIRFGASDFFLHPSPDISFIKDNIGFFRTMTIGGNYGVRHELGSAFGIQEITSINMGTLPSYMNYFHTAVDLDKNQRVFYSYYPSLRSMLDTPNINRINWQAIDLLGVKYIIAPISYKNYRDVFINRGLIPVFDTSEVNIYQNRNALPRAFTIDADQMQADILLSQTPEMRLLFKPANITLYRNSEIRLEGSVDQSSFLILTDNWHTNWTAFVNGIETPIIRVNGTFRGILVPTGKYEVYMYYQPRTLKMAAFCTCAIILLLILLVINRKNIDDLLNKWLSKLY
ncbi:MAG: hypothetical protein NTW32_22970 [Chloroflexi bacterium]|nr:hypothetical protein [Chloroflexota bacterium]